MQNMKKLSKELNSYRDQYKKATKEFEDATKKIKNEQEFKDYVATAKNIYGERAKKVNSKKYR